MPNIQLIATDMDGTLLNSKHELPNDFYQTFEMLCQKDILFVAASGRQYYNLLHVFEKIAEKMAFIAENGSLIVLNGTEISSSTIPAQIVISVIDIIEKIPDAGFVICGKDCAYYSSDNADFLYNIGMYYGRRQKVSDLKNHVSDCLKIAVYCGKGTEENIYPKVKHLSEKDLQVVVSGKVWLDMMPNGTNKGVALLRLQKLLNIQPSQTAAFGDYMNDIEMLQNAQYSYAMGNAHPDVKKVANFVSQYSNEQEGVIKEIRKMVE